MRNSWRAAVVLLATGPACGPTVKPEAPARPNRLEELRPSPVSLIGADALGVRLKETANTVRLFNFWATWCGPCVAELPLLRDFAAETDGVSLVLVSLDLPSKRRSKVGPFVREQGLDHLVNLQLDTNDAIGALHSVIEDWPDQVPVTLVVARDGRTVERFEQAVTREQLVSAVGRAQ
jgi:thiol-disulfide isomerase/thioredoxin